MAVVVADKGKILALLSGLPAATQRPATRGPKLGRGAISCLLRYAADEVEGAFFGELSCHASGLASFRPNPLQ